MFHGDLDRHTKDSITSEYVKHTSKIRVLVSTVAFGMGVSVPDIRSVIHWGASSDCLNYWQEVGMSLGTFDNQYVHVLYCLFPIQNNTMIN